MLFISAGVYLFWHVKFISLPGSKNNPLVFQSKLSPSLQEVVSRVEVANKSAVATGWKTYHPKNLEFTFNYPGGLLLQDTQNGINIYADTSENRAYIQNPNGYEGSRPGMFIVAIGSNQVPESYAKQNFSGQEYVSTSLFGQKAIVLTGQGMDRWDVIIFTHNNMLYKISIQYGAPNDEMRTNYYKILSSFSF